ncbi:stage II sporulation protein R [Caldisalinibacter kiritimatiensis]|uniref:Stage II sporulation protein required for processing of pro-sigma-E (SpoIIR) n=1 Tax=Caldisalinibacter kiritimatiensis TaxID=1304284 RepID=R1AWV7_9FIRM|nr:stage II sporulation protein R [Caldisalinibacter kiritimatiensis]EOD01683.1 Stage II sporulation protein required for processing of pro-sigma-E (SpoIIR) [Caldisalinibacter kiritimatiensis]
MLKKYRLTIVLLILIIVVSFISLKDVYKNRDSYKQNLIRFHVIANSDSPEDQNLKRKVRDKVIKEMNQRFEDVKSINESRSIIKESLDDIKYLASEEVKNNGKDYNVDVHFGTSNFPTKTYGNFTLPAGEYEAVRVVIGEGKGQNWWCVMFPPLCFVDITHGLTNEKTKNELKQVLSEEEYNMIINAKNEEEVPLKLKFKVVELLEKGKMRFAKLFIGQR